MQKMKLILLIPVGICVVLAGFLYAGNKMQSLSAATRTIEGNTYEVVTTKEDVRETTLPEVTICVYICGAVQAPGVYYLDQGDRVFDVIQAAKGMTEDANVTSINQAELVTDGQMIYIPLLGENTPVVQGETTKGLVNLNTADAELLMTLPGVGESKAAAIIAYREDQGGFKDISDIMNVAGIKESSYNKIKDYICVN